MRLIFCTLATFTFSAIAFAGPVYYKGEQTVGIAGDLVACFVEAEYLSSGLKAKVRSLVADPHGDGDLVGFGPVEANYETQELGYRYKAKDDHEKVQELFLAAQNPNYSESLDLAVLDGHHADYVKCRSLQGASGGELTVIKAMFDHFDDYTGEEDHDHGQHSH